MQIRCLTLCAFSWLSASQNEVKEIAPEVAILLEQKKFLQTSPHMQQEVQKFFSNFIVEEKFRPTSMYLQRNGSKKPADPNA